MKYIILLFVALFFQSSFAKPNTEEACRAQVKEKYKNGYLAYRSQYGRSRYFDNENTKKNRERLRSIPNRTAAQEFQLAAIQSVNTEDMYYHAAKLYEAEHKQRPDPDEVESLRKPYEVYLKSGSTPWFMLEKKAAEIELAKKKGKKLHSRLDTNVRMDDSDIAELDAYRRSNGNGDHVQLIQRQMGNKLSVCEKVELDYIESELARLKTLIPKAEVEAEGVKPN